MNRRGFLAGLIAAPAIIRTPGLLMPIRPFAPINPINPINPIASGDTWAAITDGWQVGDLVWRKKQFGPSNTYELWRCVVAGELGTWKRAYDPEYDPEPPSSAPVDGRDAICA